MMRFLPLLFLFYSCSASSQEVAKPLAASGVADVNATQETKKLFQNLQYLMKEDKTLIGQQDAFSSFFFDIGGKSDIKKTTGADPALLGLDFAFITADENNGKSDNWFYQQELQIKKDALDAYAKGMLITFCWHLPEPFEGKVFYTDAMTDFQKQNAFKSILPGGEKHDYYKKKLDKIAFFLKELKTSNALVPVVFRPFHEFDGNWFWWGKKYCTPEEYKQLWIFTVDYLRNVKGLHNVLYAFSPDQTYRSENEFLQRYPGDAYVDILGIDDYADFDNKGAEGVAQASAKLTMLTALANDKNKIAALTETGYRITFDKQPINNFFTENMYSAIKGKGRQIAFVMFWRNDKDGYYVPQPNMPDTQDFLNFTQQKGMYLQKNMPDLYGVK